MDVAAFFEPSGRIRRDPAVIARLVGAARRDPGLNRLVLELGNTPVGYGTFGVLLSGRGLDGPEVVVKVNASPSERQWLTAVDAADPGAVPRVVGDGDSLDGIALGWLAMERLRLQPPGMGARHWYPPLLRGAARWHAATRGIELPVVEGIDDIWLRKWLDQAVITTDDADVRRLRDRFADDWTWLIERCAVEVCHGDVHFFNAASRSGSPDEALVLFDPIPRRAPWAYDPANTQTLTNYHRFSSGASLVEQAAELRRQRDEPTPDPPEVRRISALTCAWLSLCWSIWFADFAPDLRGTALTYTAAALAYD